MKSDRSVDIRPFQHLYPFQSHYMARNGFRMHYLDEGLGDPVVMLHGNPTWSFYYRSLVTGLSSGYRTIVPDHIGCGLSDKPDETRYGYRYQDRVEDLEALLEYLQINRRITLVLHDWGGMIGLAFALRNPGKISRLVITNTTGFFTPGGKGLPLRLWLIRHIAPFATVAVKGFNVFAKGAVYMAPYRRLPKEVSQALTAPYNSWENRIATLKFVQDIPVRPGDPSYALGQFVDQNLHRLSDLPMLICWGKHDFVFTPDFYREWQRRFPKAEYHLFEDAGHYLLEDVPDRILSLVEQFLEANPIDNTEKQE